MSKALLFRTPSMMMAEMFLDPDEKETISSCFELSTEMTKGFIYFMLECARNQLWFGKDKNLLTMAVYKKMISQDMLLLRKFLGPFNPTNTHHISQENYVQEIENLQCAVNLFFLIKQLKICDFKPYREWVDKFEGSEMYTWYKNKKPYFDRCQRLK